MRESDEGDSGGASAGGADGRLFFSSGLEAAHAANLKGEARVCVCVCVCVRARARARVLNANKRVPGQVEHSQTNVPRQS